MTATIMRTFDETGPKGPVEAALRHETFGGDKMLTELAQAVIAGLPEIPSETVRTVIRRGTATSGVPFIEARIYEVPLLLQEGERARQAGRRA